LKGKRGGFFLEIGGYDGEKFSNSLFFERQRDWKGLLVEANPFTYKQMVNRDRKCSMAHACISRTRSSMKFKVAGGITAAVELSSKAHLDRMTKNAAVYGEQKEWAGHGQTVETKCTTINALLEEIGVSHVDYFSLDVEGAEVHVLESIDWSKVSFGALSIAVDWRTQSATEQTSVPDRDVIHRIMESHGYRRLEPGPIPDDDIYVPLTTSTRMVEDATQDADTKTETREEKNQERSPLVTSTIEVTSGYNDGSVSEEECRDYATAQALGFSSIAVAGNPGGCFIHRLSVGTILRTCFILQQSIDER